MVALSERASRWPSPDVRRNMSEVQCGRISDDRAGSDRDDDATGDRTKIGTEMDG